MQLYKKFWNLRVMMTAFNFQAINISAMIHDEFEAMLHPFSGAMMSKGVDDERGGREKDANSQTENTLTMSR